MKATSKIIPAFIIGIFAAVLMEVAYAQVEQLGGPYTTDANTRLLLHFDGDFKNASPMSAEAVPHGVYYFLPNDALGLGQCLRLSNSSNTDSSYVTVPDTSSLDLTGDWTIEGWLNIVTFGDVAGEWRWVPRLVIKPGDDVFWHPNYWVEMWGDNRLFHTGYYSKDQDAFISNSSPNNVFAPGIWVHLTFIRDATNNLIIQMVHDANRQLLSFEANGYDPTIGEPPNTTSQDVHIGWAGSKKIAEPSVDSWLDGFVDEIRISDIVRNFDIPPAIYKVTVLGNQPSTASAYAVQATVKKAGASGLVTNVKLHYSLNTGGWLELPMTPGTNDIYTASLPSQPVGSRIRYYFSAEDNSGHRTLQPSNAEDAVNPTYHTFWVYQPNTQTLGLSFEEGAGRPVDSSPYKQTVTVIGSPTYTSDAKVGSKAFYFPGDSTRLDVDSPFLSSEEFTLDFWLRPDTLVQFTRLIIKPTVWNNWTDFNYAIRLEDQPTYQISARFVARNLVQYALILDSTLTVGRWHHLIYEVSKDSAVFQMRDQNDRVIQQKGLKVVSPPINTTSPLRIGNAHNISVAGWEQRSFRGALDDFKVYNYPAAGLTTGVKTREGAGVPTAYALMPNFPNPFNPTTEIRFAIPRTGKVTLAIYDVLGREVKRLFDKQVEAGFHSAIWDGTDKLGKPVGSGIYLYRLQAKDYVGVRKMTLIK